ncbi:ribonuclease H-like domain-containing protein, partial [Mortierella sp. GBAus27b]
MRKEESKSEEAAPKATEDEPPKQAPTQEQAQKPNQKSTQEPTQEPSQGKKSRRALHKNSRYDYYLCFDVEATCEEGYSFEFPNEVIEFPVVLLDGSTLEVVDEFHSYVRPVYRPILSDFCKGLTGISQETVDDAPTFTEVLVLFQDWLKSHGIILGEGNPKKAKKSRNPSFCFVTDGPFDIRDFIGKQCLHSQIPRPSYFAQSYLDVRTLFRHYFDLIQWCNLEAMLTFLGETFTGRQHSGICDTRMVALILKRLA